MINTFAATAGAMLAWLAGRVVGQGHPSLLGAVSGAIAGLVAVTPAAGLSGRWARSCSARSRECLLHLLQSVKHAFGYDDSLDVFGIHGVGGIIGSIGTGILVSPALGGVGV